MGQDQLPGEIPSPRAAQQGAPASVAAPGKQAPVAPSKVRAEPSRLTRMLEFVVFGQFLKEDFSSEKFRLDESSYLPKQRRLLKLIRRQTYVIIALVILIIASAPYLQPIQIYNAKVPAPANRNLPLTVMTEPNLTDEAVLSWVEASITEILTFGFGDFDRRIISQKHRFTKVGWESFLQTVRSRNMRSDFKMQQLVLTTAPAETPVIVSKGVDADQEYIWKIEMPIIMTYTTNNNVRSGRKSIVSVTVARVPSSESVRGIGIKRWMML
ncbi:MAG: DotI/IcmL family type IV secretion protein [Alphaproteobacteria bacterium]|nr:DotI/IcmL family type IV secretion protein [Alphaproteobacteria bacterium]